MEGIVRFVACGGEEEELEEDVTRGELVRGVSVGVVTKVVQ